MTGGIVRIGFLPLVDAAMPILARELGFAADEGLQLELVRDLSWATVRDRLIYGRTDAAHLPAPLAIATSLGLGQPAVPIVAPFNLGLNGNAITLATPLARELRTEVADPLSDPTATGLALARMARNRAAKGHRLRLAVVHRYSSHNYMLRYWLSASGIDPEQDVEMVVVPPPLTAEALKAREIDGACAGEPWNSLAVDEGAAEIICVTSLIWKRGVEKVLSLKAETVRRDEPKVLALIRALDRAARFAENPERQDEVAEILSRSEYLNQPAERIGRALSGHLRVGTDPNKDMHMQDFYILWRDAANFPWVSQALWLYAQMVRWKDARLSPDADALVRDVFQPWLYRRALTNSGTPLPGALAKVEGAIGGSIAVGSTTGRLILGCDKFFDGRAFDPVSVANYLEKLPHRTPK